MGWLDDRVALVVGGGSGIGRAVVHEFVREGARVAVLELDAAKCADLRRAEPSVLCLEGDATSGADNARAVAEAVDAFGRLDTLATFVGVFDYSTRLEEMEDETLDEAFDELFATNVKSYLLSARAALGALRESRGNIVFTVSTSGFYPGRGGVLYVASKFAVRGIVLRLALELAPAIRVNGVAPGGTLATDLRGVRALGLADRRLGETPDREQALRKRTPLQVALAPEDHAGAYVYLASDRARGVTGVIVNSDGGMGVRP